MSAIHDLVHDPLTKEIGDQLFDALPKSPNEVTMEHIGAALAMMVYAAPDSVKLAFSTVTLALVSAETSEPPQTRH